jgi:hypothetical protein
MIENGKRVLARDANHDAMRNSRRISSIGGIYRPSERLAGWLQSACDALDPGSPRSPEWVKSGEVYRLLPM